MPGLRRSVVLTAAGVGVAACACLVGGACTVFDGISVSAADGSAASADGPPTRFCGITPHTACSDFDGAGFDIGTWQAFDVASAKYERDDASPVSAPFALHEHLTPRSNGVASRVVLRQTVLPGAASVQLRFGLRLLSCPPSPNGIDFASIAMVTGYAIRLQRTLAGPQTLELVEQLPDGSVSTLEIFVAPAGPWHDVDLVLSMARNKLHYKLLFDGQVWESDLFWPRQTLATSLDVSAGLSVDGPTDGCEAIYDNVAVDAR